MKYIFTFIRFILALIGMVLMMCESPDMKSQIIVVLVGFGLFLIGTIPSIIKGAREIREAE